MSLSAPNDSRYEMKFICYEDKYKHILNWIKFNKSNFFREYKPRKINNIYFDSFDNKSYNDNISGISSRAKIRYRWYGNNFDNHENGKLEFKLKRNLFGWKKKIIISNELINSKVCWYDIIKIIDKKLDNKLKEFFKFNCFPQIINQYDRDYFVSFNKKIRVTVDKNHRIFDQRFFRYPNLIKKKIVQNYIVIEFKFNRNDIDYYKSLLDNFIPIQLSKNSKYVNSIRAVTGI